MNNEIKKVLMSAQPDFNKATEQNRKKKANQEAEANKSIAMLTDNSQRLTAIILKRIVKTYIDCKNDRAKNIYKKHSKQEIITVSYDDIALLDVFDYGACRNSQNSDKKKYYYEKISDIAHHQFRKLITLLKDWNSNYKNDNVDVNPIAICIWNTGSNRIVTPGIFNRQLFDRLGFKFDFDDGISIQSKVSFEKLEEFVISFLKGSSSRQYFEEEEINQMIMKINEANVKEKNATATVKKCMRNLNIVSLDIVKKLIDDFKRDPRLGEYINFTTSLPCIYYDQRDYRRHPKKIEQLLANYIDSDLFSECQSFTQNYDEIIYLGYKEKDKIKYLPVILWQFVNLMGELMCDYSYTSGNDEYVKQNMTISTNSLAFANLVFKQKGKEDSQGSQK